MNSISEWSNLSWLILLLSLILIVIVIISILVIYFMHKNENIKYNLC